MMFDQHYFDDVLPDQVRLMENRPLVRIHLHGGQPFWVRRMLAAHASYVVLEVRESAKRADDLPERSDQSEIRWPLIEDQLAVPYSSIASVLLTARMGTADSKEPPDEVRAQIGFRLPEPSPVVAGA